MVLEPLINICQDLGGIFRLLMGEGAATDVVLNSPCSLLHNSWIIACVNCDTSSVSWVPQGCRRRALRYCARHGVGYDLCALSMPVQQVSFHHLFVSLNVSFTLDTSALSPPLFRMAAFAQRVAVGSRRIRRKTVLHAQVLLAPFMGWADCGVLLLLNVSPVIERAEMRRHLLHLRRLHREIVPDIIDACSLIVEVSCDLLSAKCACGASALQHLVQFLNLI